MLSLIIPIDVKSKVLKRLSRLAAKCGVEYTEVEGSTWIAAPHYEGEDLKYIECHRVTLGDLPSLQGWTFVARLEHTEGGVIIANAPGQECPSVYRDRPNLCEHCGTKRQRNETLIIRSPEGELRQVGRNCLADYLTTDATRWVKAAELVKFVYDDLLETRLGYGTPCTPTLTYVAYAVTAVRQHGFHRTGDDGSTRGTVNAAMSLPPKDAFARKEWEALQPTEADIVEARAIIQWGKEMEADNDYMANLKVALSCPGVIHRREGLVASSPKAYATAMNRAQMLKVRETESRVEAPEGRVEVEGEVLKLDYYDNDFGSTLKMTLKVVTPEGYWMGFGTVPRAMDPHRGDKIKIRATFTPKPEDTSFAFFKRPTAL